MVLTLRTFTTFICFVTVLLDICKNFFTWHTEPVFSSICRNCSHDTSLKIILPIYPVYWFSRQLLIAFVHLFCIRKHSTFPSCTCLLINSSGRPMSYSTCSVFLTYSTWLHGRRRHRWEDHIKVDVEELSWQGRNWINLAVDRDK